MPDRTLRARPVPLKAVVGLSALAIAILGLVCGDILWQTRADVERQADEAAAAMALALDREVTRTVQVLDLSLKGAIDAQKLTSFAAMPSQVQQVMLFDWSARADFVGAILIVDAAGNVVRDSRMDPPAPLNLGDRPYFLAHQTNLSPDLRIGAPLKSRASGLWIVPLSRRITNRDGSFGGVVVAGLDLAYFDRLLAGMHMGPHAATTIFMNDGTVVARNPGGPPDGGRRLASASLFDHYPRQRSGHYHAASVDGIARSYSFSQLGTLPMVANVGVASVDVNARWWGSIWRVAAMLGLLVTVGAALAVFLARELHSRYAAEKKLVEAALTDPLTGARNRRAFSQACAAADARGCVLMVDVDRFKAFNDRNGHVLGDMALTQVAQTVRTCCRAQDLVCRYGGEEFAVLLHGADRVAGAAIAERIRLAVAEIVIPSPQGSPLRVTVSIGVAVREPAESWEDAQRRADAALYAAKEAGRDRVVCAPEAAPFASAQDRPAAA